MPVEYQLDPVKRLIVVVDSELVTFEEWAAALTAAFSDPAYEPGFNLLVDRRASTPPSRAFADAVAAFIRRHRRKFGDARFAILVSDAAAFGMARMQEMLNESADLETRAFWSEAEALEWLAGRRPADGT